MYVGGLLKLSSVLYVIRWFTLDFVVAASFICFMCSVCSFLFSCVFSCALFRSFSS